MVQWWRLGAPNAGGSGSIPGHGIRSHMRMCMLSTKDPECLTGVTK